MKKIGLILPLLYTCSLILAQSDWGEVDWNNGMVIENPKKQYKIKFGGRIMMDLMSAWPEQNGVIDTIVAGGSGVEFRRIRFFNSGEIYKNIKYKLQFDFAGGGAFLKDAYIIVTKIPVIGNLQFGHFKEPIGLELLASSKYITFMERGLTNPMTPERNTGVMAFNTLWDKRFSWAFGYFVPADKFGEYTGGKYNLTGRIAGTPFYNLDGTYRVFHLGMSMTHQYQNNEYYELKSRPESHLLPTIAIAEIDYANAVNQVGLEAAWIHGPFSIQGEYIYANAQTSYKSELQNDSYNFIAYYAYASWFITGESRKYKQSATTFNRVRPKKNFGSSGGSGAWEIGFRYSELDLEDTDIHGGNLCNMTAGINWHLNPATRVMFNYILSDLDGSGKFSIFQARVQVDF